MPAAKISARDRKIYLDRALKAADWFVNSQMRCDRVWLADDGRFLYYWNMPQQKFVPGINWSHGRAIFTLADAWRITGEARYLDSALLGARYMRALQPLDPHYPVTYGSIRETIPQSPWGGVLDGAQAASGFIMLYHMTGDADYLRRGRAFCDFLVRTWRRDVGLASKAEYYPERIAYEQAPFLNCIHHCSAIPLWHLHSVTGEGQYLPALIDAADRILDCQRDDGALKYIPDTGGVDAPPPNHHWGFGEGDDRFTLVNDDGCVTVVLAAYAATGDPKYLDSMVAYAEWTVKNLPRERPFNAFGVQAANVLDVGAVSGRDYTSWVLDNLQKHCLDLQVEGSGDARADGGFRGEDEEGEGGIFGGKSLDYVVTRTTCYMAGLLFRLSGRGTGTGFSVFGYQKA